MSYGDVVKCQKCGISRLRAVPGAGSINAKVMFIGEAPGYHEDQQGVPFVGPAGRVLDDLLQSINLKRTDVFIDNLVKCRPPDNRDPMQSEIDNCAEWLTMAIKAIKPKVIVTLGKFATFRFFSTGTISAIHGTTKVIDGITYYAMYHPASVLYNPSLLKTLQQDMLKLPTIISMDEERPKQIGLF